MTAVQYIRAAGTKRTWRHGPQDGGLRPIRNRIITCVAMDIHRLSEEWQCPAEEIVGHVTKVNGKELDTPIEVGEFLETLKPW